MRIFSVFEEPPWEYPTAEARGSAPTSPAAAAAGPPPPSPSLEKRADDVWLAKIEGRASAWLGEVLALSQRVHAQALDEMVVPDVYVQAYAAADPKGKANAAELAPSAFDDLSERYPRAAFEASRANGSRRCRAPIRGMLDGAQWAAAQGARHAARLGAAPRRTSCDPAHSSRSAARCAYRGAYLVSELRRLRHDAAPPTSKSAACATTVALGSPRSRRTAAALCRACADEGGARELLKAHARARGAADGASARRASLRP